jgi:hypothetical protein
MNVWWAPNESQNFIPPCLFPPHARAAQCWIITVFSKSTTTLVPPLSTPSLLGHAASAWGYLPSMPAALNAGPPSSTSPSHFYRSSASPCPWASPLPWGLSGAGPLALNAGSPALDAGHWCRSPAPVLFPVNVFFNFVSNLRIVWMKIDYDRVILDEIWVC